MEEQVKQKQLSFISPQDKEIMEAVIKATCDFFEVTEEEMLTISNKPDAANIRRLAIYLIMTSTSLKPAAVADRFKVSRFPIISAVDIIDTHRKIYKQTAYSLNSIATIANNFEKKHQWQISL